MRELLPKNALGVFSCPVFLTPWIQSSSDICIFTAVQKERFSVPLLHGGGWYLECSSKFIPDEEIDFYNSLSGSASAPVSSHPHGEEIEEGHSSLPAAVEEDKTVKKKRRLTRAEKAKQANEEAEKAEAAKKAEIEEAVAAALATRAQVNVSAVPSPVDVTRDDDIGWNSSPIMASSQAGGSSLLEVTRMEVHERKKRQFQQSDSSAAAVRSVYSESFIQNSSLFLVMQSLTQPGALPQPWSALHEFITKVRCLCQSSHALELLVSFTSSLLILFLCRLVQIDLGKCQARIANIRDWISLLPIFRRTYPFQASPILLQSFLLGMSGRRSSLIPSLSLLTTSSTTMRRCSCFMRMTESCNWKLKTVHQRTSSSY